MTSTAGAASRPFLGITLFYSTCPAIVVLLAVLGQN